MSSHGRGSSVMEVAEAEAADPRSSTPRRSARGPFLLGAGVLLLVAIAVAGWTGYEAWRLHREADAAVDPLRRLDTSSTAFAADRRLMQESAGHARRATRAADTLPLRVASRLPFVGDDVRAARVLAHGLDTVVDRAGIPVTGLLDRMVTRAPDAPPGAFVDTADLRTAGPTVTRAAAAVHDTHARLAAIDTTSLAGPVRRPVEEARRRLAPTDVALTDAATDLPALTGLLGADGPRRYLLVFQNLAEARPTGGLIGKWATVDVDRSRLRMTGTGTNEDLSSLSLRNLPALPRDFVSLYGASLGPVANANLSPDFPSAARILLATWKQQGHAAPAGVISVDTRAIARVLALTGPVRVAGPHGPVTVSSGTVTDIVQNRVYGWFEGREEARQRFLTSLTSTTFARLAAGGVSTTDLAGTVQDLVRSHDVTAYATDPAQQRAFTSLGVSGSLEAPAVDRALVHLTDNGGGKLDNYLAPAACSTPGTIGLRLTNTLPRNYASFVPRYALNQRPGAARGTNLLTASVYLPSGRGVSRVLVNGRPAGVSTGTEKGWTVVRIPLSVPAATSATVVLDLTGRGSAPALSAQPLTRSVTTAYDLCRK